MDESTIKAMKLLDERDEVLGKTRVIRDVSVEGFENCSLQSLAYIRFEGEGAQEKALELDGTDVGGWTAIVKPAMRPLNLNFPSRAGIKWSNVLVTGFDTGLPAIDIKIALHNHFSSCGEVRDVALLPGDHRALITIGGERCEDKALELSGRKMGEKNLVVSSCDSRRLVNPNACGYMLGSFSAKRKEMEKEKEKKKMMVKMEKEKEKMMVKMEKMGMVK